jgi:hypothetical protein
VTGSSGKKTLRGPEELAEAVKAVAKLAKAEGVRVALLGGYALQRVHGSPRLTGDVDFVADRRLDGLPPGPALSFGGEQTEAPNGVPVDLVLRDDEWRGLYEEALDKAHGVKGVTARVVLPEYLVAMKMVAGRPRDHEDVAFLVTSGEVNRERARKVLRKHLGPFAVLDFDRAAEQAEFLASRGRL